MGWAIIVGHTKRQFQTTSLLEVDSKSEFLKNKHFTSYNVSKRPYPKVSNHVSHCCDKLSKKKQYFYFFQCLLDLCVFSNFKKNLCIFPIPYTCLHVISYKCKYVLFHLNMLRLFQDINMFFF